MVNLSKEEAAQALTAMFAFETNSWHAFVTATGKEKVLKWVTALEVHLSGVREVSRSVFRPMGSALSLNPCACCTHGFVTKDVQTVRFPAFSLNTSHCEGVAEEMTKRSPLFERL